jgi:hypothetical protein
MIRNCLVNLLIAVAYLMRERPPFYGLLNVRAYTETVNFKVKVLNFNILEQSAVSPRF